MRAFHVADFKQVVASLWKVDDEATAALMACFYHNLWVKQPPPLAALREAHLYLYRHPERLRELAQGRGLELVERELPPADLSPKAKRKRPSSGRRSCCRGGALTTLAGLFLKQPHKVGAGSGQMKGEQLQ